MEGVRELGLMVKSVSNLLGRRMHHFTPQAQALGFTRAHGQIIHFLVTHQSKGDLFQRDVEEEFSIRRPTATGILQLMEKNDLIRREPVDYDARLKRLILTEKAMALDEEIVQAITQMEALLASGSTKEELDVFYRVMCRMKDTLENC